MFVVYFFCLYPSLVVRKIACIELKRSAGRFSRWSIMEFQSEHLRKIIYLLTFPISPSLEFSHKIRTKRGPASSTSLLNILSIRYPSTYFFLKIVFFSFSLPFPPSFILLLFVIKNFSLLFYKTIIRQSHVVLSNLIELKKIDGCERRFS